MSFKPVDSNKTPNDFKEQIKIPERKMKKYKDKGYTLLKDELGNIYACK